MITTKEDTSLKDFKNFIDEVDGGVGEQMVFSDEQTYITKITYETAKEAAKNPIVDYVMLDCPVKLEADMNQSNPNQPNIQAEIRSGLTKSQPLRILSSRKEPMGEERNGQWDPYSFDPILGKGQTIYILDKGFNFGKTPVSARTYSKSMFWVLLPVCGQTCGLSYPRRLHTWFTYVEELWHIRESSLTFLDIGRTCRILR